MHKHAVLWVVLIALDEGCFKGSRGGMASFGLCILPAASRRLDEQLEVADICQTSPAYCMHESCRYS